MYAVIGRRHGKILSGDLTQGSGNFAVTCLLPVIESFNFAQEMRKQTSGLACPQLMFSHWEVSCSCCTLLLHAAVARRCCCCRWFWRKCATQSPSSWQASLLPHFPLSLSPNSPSLCLAICHVRCALLCVVVCAWSAARNLSLPWLGCCCWSLIS